MALCSSKNSANCGNMDSPTSIPGTVITLEFDGKENKSKEAEAMAINGKEMENGFATVIDMRGVNGKLHLFLCVLK